jgi:serine/threonine protein kinase
MSLNHSEQFYWLDPLGVGASRVRKVRHKYNSQVPISHLEKSFLTDQESACKEITPDGDVIFDVRCIDAVARSNNPNIAQVIDRWHEAWPSQKVFVQTELCFGDLYQYIAANRSAGTQINHRDMWNIILDITDGLTYAHSLGWSHRNLKPTNGMSSL